MSLHPGPCAKGLIVLLMILLGYACQSWGQQQTSNNDNWKQIYEQLRICALTGGSSHVHNLTLKRDRGVMTFEDGTFYFGAPVAGQVREAIFIGSGKFSAEPPSDFERDNLRRMLNDDTVSEIFVAAVLRFTDDTYSVIGHGLDPKGIAPSEAEQLASEFDRRFLNETGANVSSRELISILNRESPGFFLGEFDRGKGKRFVFLLDRQCRIPAANFGIDAGEKGLILGEIEEGESGQVFSGTDVWMAFYALEEYQSRRVGYAHTYTLVDVTHYDLSVDLREPQKALALTARMDLLARRGDIRAVPFKLSEDLGFSARAEHHLGLRVKAVRLAGGSPLDFVQEPMEGGFTLLLPAAPSAGEKLSVEADVQGNFMYHWNAIDTFYPLSNSSWYPRNSSLQRSTFDLKFVHRKNTHVASVGQLVQEKASPDNADERVTEYRMDQPVPFATFAAGHFEVHTDTTKLPNGAPLSIELYSIGGREFPIKEDFMLAEMNNCVRYFSALFGPYQYPVFRAVLHPFGFGQGFPTMLMIPKADLAQKRTFSFIAHETSHQWWGDLVLWRSYRDLWLSEGFAEYSGASYTGLRTKAATELDLIDEMRAVLKYPPGTQARVGEGRLADVGPLILGHRLETRNTHDERLCPALSKPGRQHGRLLCRGQRAQQGDGVGQAVWI